MQVNPSFGPKAGATQFATLISWRCLRQASADRVNWGSLDEELLTG